MAENNQANAPAQEQDLSEILKVRREKLAALRAEGRDPFQQTRFDVSHHAQDIILTSLRAPRSPSAAD